MELWCFTVFCHLKEFRLKTRSAAMKFTISKKNKLERLSLAETHVKLEDEHCSKVHFSDKSKFNLVGSDGRQSVRYFTEDWLKSKSLKKSAKFGERNVMLWVMISSEGISALVQIKWTINAISI